MTRLLFIDDDPKAQDTLKMVLADTYQVTSAFTGAQGIEIVREENPDVVLLDITRPTYTASRSSSASWPSQPGLRLSY